MCHRILNPHSTKIPLKSSSPTPPVGKVTIPTKIKASSSSSPNSNHKQASHSPPPPSSSAKSSEIESETSSSPNVIPTKPKLKLKLKLGGGKTETSSSSSTGTTTTTGGVGDVKSDLFSPVVSAQVKKPSSKSPNIIPKKASIAVASGGEGSKKSTDKYIKDEDEEDDKDEDYVDESSSRSLPFSSSANTVVPNSNNTVVSVWVDDALKILSKLMKHEWVSLQKDKGLLYCFAWPVTEQFPIMANDYLNVIKKPMDLTTVERMLKNSTKGKASTGNSC